MSKHETSNQFNNGLMMDVHPLQTPNTVLTDCLNGTFITYNGNEHVLQNDMGNYKLEKCKLKENYIPIGTASYGDILYIASYNPIDKKFELGSYPSPLQWNSLDDNSKLNLYSIIDQAIANDETDDHIFKYSDLTKNTRSIIFNRDSKLKLEPGDQYKIETDSENSIESLIYFVQDENGIEHTITPEINSDFKNISWQIPGYLGIKNKILTPYSHSLVLLKATIMGNSVSYDFQSLFQIMDYDLCEQQSLEDFCNKLSINIQYSYNNVSNNIEFFNQRIVENSTHFFNLEEFSWLSDKKQLVCKYHFVINYGDGVLLDSLGNAIDVPTTITVTPIYTNDDYKIRYDNLEQSLTYIANGSNISSVADNIFYWEYDDSNEEWNINFEFNKVNDDDLCEFCYFSYGNFPDNLDNIEMKSCDPGTNTQSLLGITDNNLVLVIFKLTTNQTSKLIGRWLFTNKDPKMTSQGRMDIECNLQQELYDYYRNILRTSASVKINNTTWKSPDSVFNISPTISSVLLDKILFDTKFEYKTTINNIEHSNNIDKFLDKDVGLNYRYTSNKNTDVNNGVPISALDVHFTWMCPITLNKIKIDSYQKYDWICFNQINKVSKISFEGKNLCWQQNCRSCTDATWTKGFYWDGVSHYTNENDPAALLKEAITKKYTVVWFGVRRWANNGGSYRIRKGSKDGSDWMAVYSGNKDSVYKTFIACNSSTHGYCLVRFKNIDNVYSNSASIDCNNQKWNRKYIHTLEAKQISHNFPDIYYTANFSTNDKTLVWMFKGAPKNELGFFNEENISYDSLSSIEKLSNSFAGWTQIEYTVPEVDSSHVSNFCTSWNNKIETVKAEYKEYSNYYYQVEDLLNENSTVKELDSNLLYIYRDSSSVDRNLYDNNTSESWKREPDHLFVKIGNNKLEWDNNTASKFGRDLSFIKAYPVVTGSGKVEDDIDGYIPCYSYD